MKAALLVALSAAANLGLGVLAARASPTGDNRDGIQGPLSVDPALDCGMRTLAWNYSLFLRPDLAPQQAVFDALRLGADCGLPTPTATTDLASPRTVEAAFEDRVTARFGAEYAATWYADPINGNDSNSGTLQSPFKTVQKAVSAARSGPSPALIQLRNGTFYLSAPVLLTADDSGLTIAGYPGEVPVISGGLPLGTLSWTAYNITSGMTGPFVGITDVDGCVNNPGQSSAICSYNGTTTDAGTCANNCFANSTCTAYTWHDASQGAYALACYFRTDGAWTGESQAGHTSGQKSTKNIWMADVSSVPGLEMSEFAFGTLFMNDRRAVRARFPNGNPEIQQSPVGFTSAASWSNPIPAPDPTEIAIQEPSRPQDPWFPSFQWGLDGTVSAFNPPGSFWGTKSPPAGNQYVVPSGLTYSPSGFSDQVSSWSNASTGIVHAFHCGKWGDWAFQVGGLDLNTSTISFSKGGWQEARGCSSGGGFYIENIFEEIDAPGEWYVDKVKKILYFNFNGTGAPDPSTFEMVATQIENLITISGTSDAPATVITIANITFAHTEPTFMKPFEVPSGGDWSFYRGAAVTLEGTVGAVVDGCTFWSPGGNGLILSGFNRNATISRSEFAYAGDSAIVSAGRTNLIDGISNPDQPSGSLIAYNIMREIGLYTKQSGAYYHALSPNATLVGNAMFNLPRAGININDGFGGGHLIKNNLCFNAVRETSDHGCFNSWDREPYQWDAEEASNLIPATSYILNNYFVNNYGSSWPIDHDDGSNGYVDSFNLLLWGGFKNYLGFNKHAINNLYVYPDVSIDIARAVAARTNDSADLERVANGFDTACVMSQGATALPADLSDVWSNNTCIASSGKSDFYDFCCCDPSNPANGAMPALAGNTLYSGDGSYQFTCGSDTWSTIAEAQSHGVEVNTTFYATAPSTAAVIAMGKQLLGI